jgi:mono/diheme cytochrome c family protein
MTLVLLAALLVGPAQSRGGAAAFAPGPQSPFQRAKAEWLLRHRLPCLGCHEVGGEGGRVGPSLSALKGLRTPEYVSAMIRDPQGIVPGTIMPAVPMSPGTGELIAAYLTQREPTVGRPGAWVSAWPPSPRPSSDSAPALYGRFCAPCHGVSGGGDGYNARYLPVRPTVHADRSYMSGRSDDALFDAIDAGGYIMKRSNRMPPFGRTLTRAQIRDLVRHLRVLCGCEGPAWSRDNP